ncbi:hypothetical protein HELRODRAFT_161450 [Helobdella robusta]|uniref:Uncharacterized protein n=1 Tax=Helobdella robusta TaxID=6412 RepID=T1ERH4_HELRO|nr:hypothetical protein HELRODRAFT_161450 [Helobdella robusta]ESO02209.1 hypothetical protein HELRODRAFT_161450 [Helobdella robusta]
MCGVYLYAYEYMWVCCAYVARLYLLRCIWKLLELPDDYDNDLTPSSSLSPSPSSSISDEYEVGGKMVDDDDDGEDVGDNNNEEDDVSKMDRTVILGDVQKRLQKMSINERLMVQKCFGRSKGEGTST